MPQARTSPRLAPARARAMLFIRLVPRPSACIVRTVDLTRGAGDFNVESPPHASAYPMIFRLFRPDPRTATIRSLYGTIVAQARLPEFYARYGVPDTVEGRFEMIVLHLALFLRRLRRETGEAQALGQAVFDLFCRDMDHNLREMGVGDLRVPKEMRRLAEAFYGRLEAYDRGLNATTPETLTAALVRNVLAGASANAERLAIYVAET